jgi:PAS domain S-box-containing protein
MPLATFLTAHDIRLLAGAFMTSLMVCAAALWIIPRRPVAWDPFAIARTVLAGVILGSGLWAILVLIRLGFFPFVEVTLPLTAVAASVALAIVGASMTLAIAVHGDTGARDTVLAGSILSATVSCMLFVTMSAIAAPLVLGYDLIEVLLSMIGGTLLCSTGLRYISRAGTRYQMVLPCVLIALAIPALDIASLSSILPFTDWETASATPGALALQPLTVVFLSEIAAVLVLSRAGAQVDRASAARTRRENDRLRQLTDSTFEGLLVHRDGIVLDANAAFCAMAGLPLDALKGRRISDFAPIDPTTTQPPAAIHSWAVRHPVETDLVFTGGKSIPVEILSRAINLGDGEVQVTAVRDIGERRAAEQSARDRQRVLDLQRETEEARERQHIAEEASRAKSAFLAMMSHEIRTPMNAVLGLASTLLEDGLTREQHQVVQAIKSSGDSLLRILNDILDFSRLDSGRMTFEYGPFAPRMLVDEVLSVHSPGAAEKGVRLTGRQDVGVPERLIGDAGRIRQVLHNLVSNAVKFTRTGEVNIHARCAMRVAEQATIEWIVTDTGIGIAPEKLRNLFDAFVQADNSITRRFGGSGLGLAISKQLVEQMGGTISVTSTQGKGSTFRACLTLRIASEETAEHSGPVSDHALDERMDAIGRPLKILLAEDNATNRFVFTRMLRWARIDIDVAEDGVQAVRLCGQTRYDLICMDMSMPEMDGLDATRSIRGGDGPNRNVPIIALTANAFAEDMAACRAAGMDDFVAKPVSKDILIAAILRSLPAAEADPGPRRAA